VSGLAASRCGLRNALLAWMLVFCGATAAVAQAPPRPAKVALVSEDDSFKAASVEWVGILFDLDPGWHIYWVNPGDAGDAPRIDWKLPAGFRAGQIRWPTPARIPTGPLVDYGYRDRVLLAVPLQVPQDYESARPAVVTADVQYVICREVCIPAQAHVSLSVPSASGSPAGRESDRELFRTTRARWPKPLPADWAVDVSDTGAELVLSIRTGQREATATFFPEHPDEIDNDAPQAASPLPTGVRLTLQKSDPSAKAPAVLNGIVVLGPDRAFDIAAPVSPRR
jgi:DsbC/DsbD-like thiol-disulfide interchange protein